MSTQPTFQAFNPSNGQLIAGEFINTTAQQLDEAVAQAIQAFDVYRKKDKNEVADFLNQVAEEILALGDALINKCHEETALPLPRLQGERGRTMQQLQLFATYIREGSWVDAKIDQANPDRTPMPKSDIRQMLLPLGPVAVFGASNFPLAFSVAGGDTASALAAGCPVIFKGHPAHPATSALVAAAFATAIEKCNMPKGTFTLLQGNTFELGENLVKHPGIKAVGFTGSNAGGKALFDWANQRPEPIPVYAEMGSSNPVFILPEILKEKANEIAAGMAVSITQGVGQFCTNPGLAFVQKSIEADAFCTQLAQKINESTAATMLTAGISATYQKNLDETKALKQVSVLAQGQKNEAVNTGLPTVFKTSMASFIENPKLAEENFGPSNVLVEAQTKEEILDAARNLSGHLTATIHGTEADFENYKELFSILELKVGRIVLNGYPTGVEVCHAMVHGGPYPSTTAPQSTSVGTLAIKRFVRPVCFQDYPNFLLPNALKNENPNAIWRLIDGQFSQDKI